jgi:hypothetical protein
MEWAYGKSMLVRTQLSRVLAEKIKAGQYDMGSAAGIAREILFETPQTLLGMIPACD